MFEELIEKIEAGRIPEDNIFSYTINGMIDNIINTIKASDPPGLGAPDSEGWWWFLFKRCNPEIHLIGKDSFGNLVGKQDNAPDYDVKSWDGKWIKVIMPKGEK